VEVMENVMKMIEGASKGSDGGGDGGRVDGNKVLGRCGEQIGSLMVNFFVLEQKYLDLEKKCEVLQKQVDSYRQQLEENVKGKKVKEKGENDG
jgi:hypothetical protein